MLTPQEVSSHAFTRAPFGGYNMTAVDEFLDELTDDYTALYKENAALKAKLKVLVEKVDGYRATEDALRATLLAAQRVADSIVKDAEAKRDQLMAQAEADARQKIGAMQAEVTATQERLRSGQQDLRTFIASVREVCERELALLEQLPELPVEAEAPAAEPAAQEAAAAEEIEQSVFAAMQAEDAKAEQEAPAEEPVPDYPEGNPFETESADEPTRRIDLKDLKFGRNYSND